MFDKNTRCPLSGRASGFSTPNRGFFIESQRLVQAAVGESKTVREWELAGTNRFQGRPNSKNFRPRPFQRPQSRRQGHCLQCQCYAGRSFHHYFRDHLHGFCERVPCGYWRVRPRVPMCTPKHECRSFLCSRVSYGCPVICGQMRAQWKLVGRRREEEVSPAASYLKSISKARYSLLLSDSRYLAF